MLPENKNHALLSPDELSQAPMDSCHKELAKRHFTRLLDVLTQPNDLLIGNYTSKQAAREQLARMTLIIRDYIEHAKICRERGKLEEYNKNIESMIIDVVEAALTVGGPCKPWSQPLFINGRLWGRDQEVASVMQEQSAENVDDVIELWNIVPNTRKEKPVPDKPRIGANDFGQDIDWNAILLRSRSEANILHDLRYHEIEDMEMWESNIHKRELEELDLQWPPVFNDPEPNVGRQKERTIAGLNSVHPSAQASRCPSRARGQSRMRTSDANTPSRDLPLCSELPSHELLRKALHGVAGLSDIDGETRRNQSVTL